MSTLPHDLSVRPLGCPRGGPFRFYRHIFCQRRFPITSPALPLSLAAAALSTVRQVRNFYERISWANSLFFTRAMFKPSALTCPVSRGCTPQSAALYKDFVLVASFFPPFLTNMATGGRNWVFPFELGFSNKLSSIWTQSAVVCAT